MTKAKWTVGSLMMTSGLLVALGGLPTTDAQQPARTRPDVGPGYGHGAGGPAAPAKAPPAADVAEDVEPKPSPTPAKQLPRTTTAPSAAQRYEHVVVTTPVSQEELVKLLQKQEKAGWEFCGPVHAESDGVRHYSTLVFKRPKGGAASTPTATYPIPPGRYSPASADTFPAPSSFNPVTPSASPPASTTPAPATGNTLPALPPRDMIPPEPAAPKPASTRPGKPAAGTDTPDVTVVKLRKLNTQEARDLIVPILGNDFKEYGGTADVVTVPDAATLVIYRASKDQIAVITALLDKVDVGGATSPAKK